MRVLLVGSGGREHALGWKLASSPRVDDLISLPGNPGLSRLGAVVDGISVTDVGAIAAMARVQSVDLVVVGPEAPLAAGVVDAMATLGIPVFGPTRAAARLESSKTFAKEVMTRAGVATAASESFHDPDTARDYLSRRDGPFVVKADGLAAGKGVLVTENRDEATRWSERWLAEGPVVVEDFLDGPEVSVFAVCTDAGAVPLAPARDYKRLHDGDEGPNTGGMGSYSPVADLPAGLTDEAMRDVVEPILRQMDEEGSPFRGFLYVGLVLTSEGSKVLEFNVRLGDPETQAVLPRITSDLVDLLEGTAPEWSTDAAVNVVLAAEGYPESPVKGASIGGLDTVPDDVLVFHAGTRSEGKKLLVDGGRVLNVVGLGSSVDEARAKTYEAIQALNFPGMQFRTDIAAQS
ncbi:MAG TPA: phosphoribosylamine--glycine ligase [Acidimicrobiia bacterium]|nr:phosphoribosylamine--glycine ligase [Acidimicrobiia bacterium]